MAVGILEVAGIAAPERIVRRLHDGGAGAARLLHRGIDLLPAAHVVADGEIGRARGGNRQSGVVRDAGARPQRQPEPGFEVKKCDGAVLELLADDAFGYESERAVERERSRQIVDAERDERDARFHARRTGSE